MHRRLFLLTGLALAGCASLGPPQITPAAAPLGELEPLLGYRTGPAGLVIRVASHGCTGRSEFVFHVDRPARALAFARRRIDACKGARTSVEVAFSWRELDLPAGRVSVLNPIALDVR